MKRIGDSCGGFGAVDEGTGFMAKLTWARILVKMDGRVLPNSIEVVMGTKKFDIQLWWEISPCVGQAKESKTVGKRSKSYLRVEGDAVSRAKEWCES